MHMMEIVRPKPDLARYLYPPCVHSGWTVTLSLSRTFLGDDIFQEETLCACVRAPLEWYQKGCLNTHTL